MLKRFFIIIAASLSLTGAANAQLSDKAVFFGGFSYQIVALTAELEPSPTTYPFYGLSLGMDYVLLHSNDQASIGVNPNANFSFIFSSNSGTSLLANAPVFLLARLGAASTPYNEQKFGVGAGIGLSYSYMLHQVYYQRGQNIYAEQINQGWLNPSALVELNIRSRISDYLFRFNWSLSRPYYTIGDLPVRYRFGVAALSIMYTF